MKKFIITALFALTATTVFAEKIKPTSLPRAVKKGSVIKITADKVPDFCDFSKQIVNIGYDKDSHLMMACVKK